MVILTAAAVYLAAGLACYLAPIWNYAPMAGADLRTKVLDFFFCVLFWPWIAFVFGVYFLKRLLEKV